LEIYIHMMTDVISFFEALTHFALPAIVASRPSVANAPRQGAPCTSAGPEPTPLIGSLENLPLELLDVIENNTISCTETLG
jgi:hypothetical protein